MSLKMDSMRPTTIVGGLFLLLCGINLRHGILPPKEQQKIFRAKREIQEIIPRLENNDNNGTCISLDEKSITKFTRWITEENMKFISFNLSFTSFVNISDDLFFPYEWIWTYSGMEEAAFNMIKFPFDFDLLSCGLLSKHVKSYRPTGDVVDKSVSVRIEVTPPGCLESLGTANTSLLMQKTLQQLVRGTNYENNSMFCYEVQYNVRKNMGVVWLYLTHFFGVQRDYTGYKCCPSPHDSKGCTVSVKQTSYLWIIQMYGVIIACFLPLLLRMCPEDHSNQRKPSLHGLLIQENDLESLASEVPEIRQEEWAYLGEDRFSLSGFIKRLWLWNNPSMTVKRIRRVVFIHLSLVVILIRTLLYYFVKPYNVFQRIKHDIPIGHLCIPFGQQACMKNTWNFLGGPIVYLALYLIFGSILLCIPEDIPRLFLSSKEFSDETHAPIRTFLYITDGAFECRKVVRDQSHLSGYQKFTAKMQDRFSMLITKRFWKFFFKMWGRRFRMSNCVQHCSYISPRRSRKYFLKAAAVLPTFIFWVFLSLFCLLEMMLVIIYYGCPMVFFIKLSFSGFMSVIFQSSPVTFGNQTYNRCYLLVCLWGLASVVIFSVLFLVFFVGIFQFVTSFTFLLHMVSFTFVGMVVYPEIALSYVLAVLAIFYYIIKSFRAISDGYLVLLRMMVKVSKALADDRWRPADYELLDDEFRYSFIKENPATGMLGIPKEAFEDVIETVRPLRIQIIGAFVKLFITANIIYSSVTLIQSFHKGQNISLPARTIAVVFVGFLPEFLGIFRSKFQERVQEEKFEKRIKALVKQFWHTRFQLLTSEAVA